MNGSGDAAVAEQGSARVAPIDRWLAGFLLATTGRPPVRLVLWDGQAVGAAQQEAVATLHIRDRRTLRGLCLDPDLQFGDGFAAGRIEVDGDLIDSLTALFAAMPQESNVGWLGRMRGWLAIVRGSTPTDARANIHSHYDLGNDFYRLWLDREMVYTCAYYTSPEATLEQAQQAKMEHVCRKLNLRPGESVIEAGCGWGSLALYMARHYGVSVTAYNISAEQIRYARERAKAEGLDGRVTYIEEDFRGIQGHCDAFVAVGMLEHVGIKNYASLGRVIDRCLTANGRGLIHSVGRNSRQLMGEWIEKRIFPGSYVPSLGEMLTVLEPANFSVLDVENLRLHYARTLKDWLQRFDAVRDQVEAMFDSHFARAWRLYLGGCSAAFAAGNLQLFQLTFARPQNNELPLTRAHLYRSNPDFSRRPCAGE